MRLRNVLLFCVYAGCSGFTLPTEAKSSSCEFLAGNGPLVKGVLKRLTGPALPIAVPRNYFMGPLPPKDGSIGADGTLLIYVNPTHPEPYFDNKRTASSRSGSSDVLQILVSDLIPIPSIVEYSLKLYSKNSISRQNATIIEFDGELMEYKIPDDENIYGVSIYFLGDPGNETDYIRCSKQKPYPRANPQCNHTMRIGDLSLQASYNKSRIGDWRLIKNNVNEVIKCIIKGI